MAAGYAETNEAEGRARQDELANLRKAVRHGDRRAELHG